MNEDAERFLTHLEKCGWFRGVPEAVAEEVKARMSQRTLTSDLQAALVSVVVDSRYLLSERPYTALLEQFAAGSGGVFKPEAIHEAIEEGGTRLSFSHSGREYKLDLPAEADEPPVRFFNSINRALTDASQALGFYEIQELPWGPIAGFAFTSKKAFAAALSARLFVGSLSEG